MAQPSVVASIRPVHSLVAGVLDGVAEPVLLVQGAASPHAYSLRPSDARALAAARLVFWIGPGMETFLAKPLSALSPQAVVVSLAGAVGVERLPAREGGVWGEEAYDGAGTHARATHRQHLHESYNPHVWLDPANAEAMVRAIVAAMAEADPPRAERYRANGAHVQDRLRALDAEMRRRLAPLRAQPYLVFHDAYANLERAYGLRAVGAITLRPEQPPGARRLAELRAMVKRLDVQCVFSEPQFEPRLVRTIVDGTPARVGVLDPLGVGLAAGAGQYFALMEHLADALVECLGGS